MNNWKLTLAHILVLALASLSAVAQASGAAGASASGQSTANTKAAEPAAPTLDINTASQEELSALPGIGEAYSQKIIENRPYRAKNELVTKKVLPQATYNQIKTQIVAHRTTAHNKSTKKEKPTTQP